MNKRELELELELRHMRKALFLANAKILELQSIMNDSEILSFSQLLDANEDIDKEKTENIDKASA